MNSEDNAKNDRWSTTAVVNMSEEVKKTSREMQTEPKEETAYQLDSIQKEKRQTRQALDTLRLGQRVLIGALKI